MTGAVIGAAAWTADDYGSDIDRLPDAFPTGERPRAAPTSLTFLVVGTDPAQDAPGRAVAESVVLVRVTGDRKGMHVVLFPAGWGAGAAGEQESTLEGAFGTGGSRRLVEVVEAETGVRIDHVGLLDFAGFQTMTDALDGVTVDVPVPYRNGDHSFPAGRQQLDGSAALAYVRNADAEAQAGAALRQQTMFLAMFERVSELGLRSDLAQLTRVVDSLTAVLTVDESMDNPDLLALAWELRAVGSPEFVTAPTDARADSLWAYLRTDALGGHLDEFR